jgi:hypothetical protein
MFYSEVDMIVFKDDWRSYPQAIADTKTPNQSFLKLASLYKDMGIEHYYFHLALLQPALQGVDPHSETLSLEYKAMVLYEIDNNPWYYLREIVLDKGARLEQDDCRFRANRSNIAALWLLLACIDYIQIQPRQTGKSFGTDANSLWLMYFCYHDTALNLITKDESLRKSNIARLKKMRDEWPDYVNRNTSKDDNNQISLSCNFLGNKYYTHVSQSSEKAANNLGRGMTSPFIHIDEGPFINHIETTVSAAMGSTNTARDIARRKGKPYCTVFTTTAGNQEDRDGKYVYGLMTGGAVWSEQFFDAFGRKDLVNLIRTNCLGRALMVNLTMSHKQLGLTDQWLYDAIANARSEGDNIDRDYFNRWTSSSHGYLLPEELAKRIRLSEIDPKDHWISRENYIFRWYVPIEAEKQYVLTVDTSDAIGRDDIAITLIDSTNGATTGAAAFNETNLIRFAQWLLEFLITFENTTLVIEKQYNAQTIIDYLLLKLPERGQDPFKRIFNMIVQEKDTRVDDFNRISTTSITRPKYVYDKYRKDFGFKTNSESRKLLYSNVMLNAAKDAGHMVHDKQLIQQVLSLVVKNGRVDHASGSHDDMVISWLLGHWFLNFGINLHHYGLDSTVVMRERARHGKKMSDEERYEKKQQGDLLEKIQQIYERLKTVESRMEISRLESELGAYMSRLKSGETEGMTLDALVSEAKEQRDRRLRSSNQGYKGKAAQLLSRFGG